MTTTDLTKEWDIYSSLDDLNMDELKPSLNDNITIVDDYIEPNEINPFETKQSVDINHELNFLTELKKHLENLLSVTHQPFINQYTFSFYYQRLSSALHELDHFACFDNYVMFKGIFLDILDNLQDEISNTSKEITKALFFLHKIILEVKQV